jgi:hypothetical protein
VVVRRQIWVRRSLWVVVDLWGQRRWWWGWIDVRWRERTRRID